MTSLKFKTVTIFLLGVFGYFLLSSFIDFIIPIYSDPMLLLSLIPFWGLAAFIFIISLWIYAIYIILHSIYNHVKYGSVEEQMLRLLDKEKRSVSLFMEVAEREFMKRKISKQTFDDIQRIAGKKMVEIEAKRKEILTDKKKGGSNETKKDETTQNSRKK